MLTSFRQDFPRVGGFSAYFVSSCRPQRLAVAALLAAFAFALGASPCAAAFIQNYGLQPGNTLDYIDVTESTATDNNALYGPPSVSADSLDFTPLGFSAFSQNASPMLDFTDGKLSFIALSKSGFAMSSIDFDEGGVTTVAGIGNDNTYTDVSAAGFLNITHVDGVGINVVRVPINMTFTHNVNGTWKLATDGVALLLSWTGNDVIDLNAELTSRNIPYTRGVTRLTVEIDNALIAQSQQGTTAFIDKKDFFIVTTHGVPEPGTIGLAIFALASGVLAVRRGRR